jgi:hypothetical protein
MAKPYMLGVEVEEPALGKVMRKINALPGVINLHMDFKPAAKKAGGDKRALNGGAHRSKYEEHGDVVLMRLFGGRRDKKVTVQDMRDYFEKLGRSPSSVHNLSFRMHRAGAIKKVGKGTYTLGDPKKLAAARKLQSVENRKQKAAG